MFLCHALDETGTHLLGDGGGRAVVQLEHGLDDGELRGGGVLSGKGAPVVHHHALKKTIRSISITSVSDPGSSALKNPGTGIRTATNQAEPVLLNVYGAPELIPKN
jgi:hypothetical protein